MHIAAHPDDENSLLLAYLAKERLVSTFYLALTRGDGGQNLIGSEQGEYIGIIRTQELLAARRTDGAPAVGSPTPMTSVTPRPARKRWIFGART